MTKACIIDDMSSRSILIKIIWHRGVQRRSSFRVGRNRTLYAWTWTVGRFDWLPLLSARINYCAYYTIIHLLRQQYCCVFWFMAIILRLSKVQYSVLRDSTECNPTSLVEHLIIKIKVVSFALWNTSTQTAACSHFSSARTTNRRTMPRCV